MAAVMKLSRTKAIIKNLQRGKTWKENVWKKSQSRATSHGFAAGQWVLHAGLPPTRAPLTLGCSVLNTASSAYLCLPPFSCAAPTAACVALGTLLSLRSVRTPPEHRSFQELGRSKGCPERATVRAMPSRGELRLATALSTCWEQGYHFSNW